jgi:hypothetical protein
MPLDAFDPDRIREAAGIGDGDWMPWAYPPAFLLLLSPLGNLSFPAAWAAFTVISTLAVLAATRPLVAGRPHLLCAAALAPAFVPGFLMGQTSTLWTAGPVAALVALGSGRPIVAGVFIGLLTLKPQLGILLPVALIALGAWRCVASTTITALALALVPTAIYGPEYWSEAFAMMQVHGDTVRGSIAELELMVSVYSFLAGLGLPEPVALTIQWAVTLICAAAVFFVWRLQDLSFDAKAAVLLTAILLSSPYAWLYETALLAPAALFMLRAGILRLTPFRATLGVAMWLGLAIAMSVTMQGTNADIHRFYIVPIILIAFAANLQHALLTSRQHPEPEQT